MMSDSDLRQALLGTWRLVSVEQDMDGTLVKPYGDNPQGYLIYTADGHVFVQFAARERCELFTRVPGKGMVLLETAESGTPFGFVGYCGTFEVRDGQPIHHREFHVNPTLNGGVEARSVVLLETDRLVLADLRHNRLEWQRVQ
jgi:hypothetical protein